jgi:hypothetical protein
MIILHNHIAVNNSCAPEVFEYLPVEIKFIFGGIGLCVCYDKNSEAEEHDAVSPNDCRAKCCSDPNSWNWNWPGNAEYAQQSGGGVALLLGSQ